MTLLFRESWTEPGSELVPSARRLVRNALEQFWDGEPEDGYAYLVQWHSSQEPLIRAALSQLAKDTKQQAIGFVGTSGGATLVTP